ncbi:MAG TPA: hypothetical protein VKV95_04470 [Terriglobia bacterium]|nr:hypothetical protein [Terriglobia bacterium]
MGEQPVAKPRLFRGSKGTPVPAASATGLSLTKFTTDPLRRGLDPNKVANLPPNPYILHPTKLIADPLRHGLDLMNVEQASSKRKMNKREKAFTGSSR